MQPDSADRPEAEYEIRILLAEDNAANQMLVRELLVRRGWDVSTVSDGPAALDAVRRAHYDVVIVDVQMPAMDGLEVTRAIRRMEETGELPGQRITVIGLAAHALRGDRERCLEAGMNDYVAKPADLYRVIAKWASKQDSAPPPPADYSGLLRNLRGDRALLAELVETFVEDLPMKLERLRDAVRSGNSEALASAAHALKGTLLIFRAQRAVDLISELEDFGQESRLGNAPDLLPSFEAETERLVRFLTRAVRDQKSRDS